MQRLHPLKVPWQVSPSTPFLKVHTAEPYTGLQTEVTFIANFGLRAGATVQSEIGFRAAEQARSPYKSDGRPYVGLPSDSLVQLRFKDGLWIRMSPAFSDREVLDPHEFDASPIPYSNTIGDIGIWLRNFQSLWMKSGNCPDPGVYSVESSKWIESLSITGFDHYVIQGHDVYVEVLAKGLEWEEIQLP